MPAFDQMLGDIFFKAINEHQAIIKVHLKNANILCVPDQARKALVRKIKNLRPIKKRPKNANTVFKNLALYFI